MIEPAFIDWTPEGITFGITDERVCAERGCWTRLSSYNPGSRCSVHERERHLDEVRV